MVVVVVVVVRTAFSDSALVLSIIYWSLLHISVELFKETMQHPHVV